MPSKTTINVLIDELKNSPIDGCITGSCLLEDDFTSWEEEPDIDIFTYNENKWVHAVTWLLCNGFTYGNMKDSTKSPAIEEWKFQMMLDKGADYKHDITTIYLCKNGVSCNVSLKYSRDQEGKRYCIGNAAQIIMGFDMNLTMVAWDIKHKQMYDLRESCGMDKHVASPSPYKKWDVTPWRAWQWLRQWNRVIKYWNRGFDTRPMARFYRDKLDEVLAMPNLFPAVGDEEKSAWELATEGLPEMRATINKWLEDKEDL